MAVTIRTHSKNATIADATARLNRLADATAVEVQRTERYLSDECSVGLYATVKVREFEEAAEYLSYGRTNKAWRILVEMVGSDGEELSAKPWSDCDRETKLHTFARLPDLLEALAKKIVAQADEAEAALNAVQKYNSLPR